MKSQLNRSLRRRGKAGFTLLEIMVVVLIVGLLVSVVGPNVWKALSTGQRRTAENQITQLHSAIDLYRANEMRYPDELEDLLEADEGGEPYMSRLPLDPWNNPYHYELDNSGRPVITTFGEDGQPGGEGKNEDISSETIGIYGDR